MKNKKFYLVAAIIVAVLAGIAFFLKQNTGISDSEIAGKELSKTGWAEEITESIESRSDDTSLFVGITYKSDFSEGSYYVYVYKGFPSTGWSLLTRGTLSPADKLIEVKCADYGYAYVSINEAFEKHLICEPGLTKKQFSDKNGNPIVPKEIEAN